MQASVVAVAPFLEGLGAPRHVAEAVSILRDELARAAGDDLVSLVLYGGLMERRYRPGKSDVNVAVVLGDSTGPSFAAVAAPLRGAHRAARVEPMILAAGEVAPMARAFPTKLLHIQTHHAVLCGEDPFAGIEVSRGSLLACIERELRSVALRLRKRYVTTPDDRAAIAAELAAVVVPITVQIGALLHVSGRPPPEGAAPEVVLEHAAQAFLLDAGALRRLASIGAGAPPADAPNLCGEVLGVVRFAADLVRALEDSGA